jgi:hypothetical protein
MRASTLEHSPPSDVLDVGLGVVAVVVAAVVVEDELGAVVVLATDADGVDDFEVAEPLLLQPASPVTRARSAPARSTRVRPRTTRACVALRMPQR